MASTPPNPTLPLTQRLATYGCSAVIRLDETLTSAEQLDYLDLLPKQSNHIPVLTAVAEHQGAALLYLVDATSSDVRSDAASLAAAAMLNPWNENSAAWRPAVSSLCPHRPIRGPCVSPRPGASSYPAALIPPPAGVDPGTANGAWFFSTSPSTSDRCARGSVWPCGAPGSVNWTHPWTVRTALRRQV